METSQTVKTEQTQETSSKEVTENPQEEKETLPKEATEADEGAELKEDFVSDDRAEARRLADAKLVALESALRKINSLDPSIKTFDDLMNMENSAQFAEKVKRGYSLTDAFIIVNGKKIAERMKAAAVRSALAIYGFGNVSRNRRS